MSDNGTNIEKKISDTEYITGKIVLYHSKLVLVLLQDKGSYTLNNFKSI